MLQKTKSSGNKVETIIKEGKYIYCIIALKGSKTFGPIGIGGRGDELHTISFKNIAAVVSDSPIISYTVSRENMIAHEKAIEEVMKCCSVLPVRFCTIAESEEKVRTILEKEHDQFVALLKHIEGKKELGLKAIFKVEAIYKDILKKYADIRLLKEKSAALPLEISYRQRVEIGRMVEAALQKEKGFYEKEILDALTTSEVKINPTYGEHMVINAAFLVEKDKEAEFDRKVQALAKKFVDKMKFHYVGTVPPFNFVNLTIDVKNY